MSIRQEEIEKINYPVALHTVDILVCRLVPNDDSVSDEEFSTFEFLLGRKPGNDKFQIPGGFVDPTDLSAEDAAVRELYEETGIKISSELHLDSINNRLGYLGSFRIDDERYRNSVHKIITSFYLVDIDYEIGETAKPSDDLEELKWFRLHPDLSNFESILKENVVEKHHILFRHFYKLGQ